MVTVWKVSLAPLTRYRVGIVLIWLGVMSWAPYIILWFTGQKPSPLWFLPIHLLGVVGGSRMRKSARKELGLPPVRRKWWRVLGHGLIWFGVGAWLPYFYLTMIGGVPVEVMHVLPFHLTGVLGGILILGIDYLAGRKRISKKTGDS